MAKNWYKSGSYNALCNVCGFKRKNDQLIERWDGMMVCRPSVAKGCFETRHPQELIRPIPDQKPLPWTNPEPADVYWVDTDDYNTIINQCSVVGVYAQADFGEADCAVVGMTNGGLVI